MPVERHDKRPWGHTDLGREAAAGTQITKGAVVALKGDWSEFALTLGFPSWQSNDNPMYVLPL